MTRPWPRSKSMSWFLPSSDAQGAIHHRASVCSSELRRSSPFPGCRQVATNMSANILLLEEHQPTNVGDSNISGCCMEWTKSQDRRDRARSKSASLPLRQLNLDGLLGRTSLCQQLVKAVDCRGFLISPAYQPGPMPPRQVKPFRPLACASVQLGKSRFTTVIINADETRCSALPLCPSGRTARDPSRSNDREPRHQPSKRPYGIPGTGHEPKCSIASSMRA